MTDPSESGPSSAMPEDSGTVAGERSVASVHRIRSVQSRVSSALAMMLFGGLALVGLVWYYSSAWSRTRQPHAQAEKAVEQRAEGEMRLPSLGVVAPPERNIVDRLLDPPPTLPKTSAVPHAAVRRSVPHARADLTPLERQLSSPVIVRANSGGGRSAANTAVDHGFPMRAAEGVAEPDDGASRSSGDPQGLSDYLRPTATAAARAKRLPNPRMLLAKGTTLDCTLQTAIDSTLPGFTKCITATDTWSADGTVVLLERGSALFGETRGDVQAGQRRLFILWHEARTPAGVVVPLASPGTDPLGRAGVTGEVDRHFWARFGAAILVTVIDGAVQSAVNSRSDGVVINPSSSRDVMTEILRETMRVRPTLRKNQGERVAVLVARDVDFGGVYALASE